MFSPVVIFPDAAAAAISYLDAMLVPPVSHQIPDPRPAAFVTVRRTGGTASGVVDAAQLTFECWSTSAYEAGQLAASVRALVGSMAGSVVDGVPVYRVEELSGPQDLPDPLSTQQRWTFTAAVHVRGENFHPDDVSSS